MTETDATRRPLEMPVRFLPYLEKHGMYKIFKDMIHDLITNLPKDHLKHMRIFLSRRLNSSRDTDRVILLVSPELKLDTKALAKQLIKDLGVIVITRRYIMDRYEKHDDYAPGCISPELMSEITKILTMKDPVPQAGWLMFDHPCTVREARCLQQDGVLPTVTLFLTPTPRQATTAENPFTPARSFFQQDIEGLKCAYKATLKEVHIEPDDDSDKIATKCFNAVRACAAGVQGPLQGHNVVGAPGVYRVILIGPRGSGRKSHAAILAKHFGLVCLNLTELLNEAYEKKDDIGEKLRNQGLSIQLRAEIVRRRIIKKDCIDNGWVLTEYPASGNDFELLDNMETPPNRIVFLNADWATCKARMASQAVDWCTGKPAAPGSGPGVFRHPKNEETIIDQELDTYFTESLAELRAAAGITAMEIDANLSFDEVQVKIQAAVISDLAFAFDVQQCSQIKKPVAD